ncbi:MAG: hypothetical protein JW976_00885 [Syntrophaceae bacterium]|nr:hypothetical protein [Syntrophaceae bacterium]
MKLKRWKKPVWCPRIIILISDYYPTREKRQNLIAKDVSSLLGYSETGLLVRKGRHLNQAAKSFIELVIQEAEKRQS